MQAAFTGVAGKTTNTRKESLTKGKKLIRSTKAKDPNYKPTHTIKRNNTFYSLRPNIKVPIRASFQDSGSEDLTNSPPQRRKLNLSATPFTLERIS